MRKREEIINDPKNYEILILETLLDIRELLQKPSISSKGSSFPKRKRGRPKKTPS